MLQRACTKKAVTHIPHMCYRIHADATIQDNVAACSRLCNAENRKLNDEILNYTQNASSR